MKREKELLASNYPRSKPRRIYWKNSFITCHLRRTLAKYFANPRSYLHNITMAEEKETKNWNLAIKFTFLLFKRMTFSCLKTIQFFDKKNNIRKKKTIQEVFGCGCILLSENLAKKQFHADKKKIYIYIWPQLRMGRTSHRWKATSTSAAPARDIHACVQVSLLVSMLNGCATTTGKQGIVKCRRNSWQVACRLVWGRKMRQAP